MKTHHAPQPPTPRPPGDDAPAAPAAPGADGPPPPAAQGQEAEVLLEATRALVDPQLRAAVESLPGSIRRVAMYHFGWQEADGTPSSGPAGKA
ncbi:polyprenyl synthetase family protein, partial [Streptomyces sp. Wh19]|nr:polyprenyl synthetase family protein [Streptomyces sp. Wh19]